MDLQPIIDRVVQLGTRWQAISGRLTWALSQARQQTSGWSVVRPVVNTELPILGATIEQLLKDLKTSSADMARLIASSIDGVLPLVLESTPRPIHVPRFPTALVNIFRQMPLPPRNKPGVIFEAHVDRLACAWLSIYFPATHQFLIQPQHTFRALAPEDIQKIIRDWSIRADVGQDSFKFELDSDFDGNVGSTSTPISTRNEGMHTHSEESPEDDSEVFMQFKLPIDAHPPVDFSHVPLQPMNSDDFFNQSEPPSVLPPGMTIDSVLRAVEIANNELKRPDVSLVFQNIPSLNAFENGALSRAIEIPIIMVENKLSDGKAGIKQVRGYARLYGRESQPHMRFFACKLGSRGFEVAMFRYADDSSELVPIVDPNDNGNDGWYSPCEPFVHHTMCQFSKEVQEEWGEKCGLRWAYEP